MEQLSYSSKIISKKTRQSRGDGGMGGDIFFLGLWVVLVDQARFRAV